MVWRSLFAQQQQQAISSENDVVAANPECRIPNSQIIVVANVKSMLRFACSRREWAHLTHINDNTRRALRPQALFHGRVFAVEHSQSELLFDPVSGNRGAEQGATLYRRS